MNQHTKIIALFVSLFLSAQVYGAQVFKVKDGDSIKVKISSKELTRITVDGAGRIDKVWGSLAELEIKDDKSEGQIFIKPRKSRARSAVSFFVRDNMGSTYTIVAEQYNIPSQTVILKPKKKAIKNKFANRRLRSQPYVKRVKALMKAMATGEKIGPYGVDEVDKKIPLWKETEITLKATFSGSKLLGEVYTLKNLTTKEMVLNENEFLGFGDEVRAVALEKLNLKSKETTYLYVVRQGKEVE